jgi:hypothetical protein
MATRNRRQHPMAVEMHSVHARRQPTAHPVTPHGLIRLHNKIRSPTVQQSHGGRAIDDAYARP